MEITEELMASNEELQSTNEELQSVNEELYTVNAEYQQKIEEVVQANLDMDNIIRSADIGFIFLVTAMLVRRFTPMAAKTFNLLESDVGRPFHHISHFLDYDGLLDDISKVIDEEITVEKRAISRKGPSYRVKLAPYIDTSKNKSMGCVINLTDVSDNEALKKQLKDSYSELRSSIQHAVLFNKEAIRILLISDQQQDSFTVENCIQEFTALHTSFSLSHANTFGEAIDVFNQRTIDICLLDMDLCDKLAMQQIPRLQTEIGAPGFIALSEMIDQKLMQSAAKLGIFDVLDKATLSPALLERSIRYVQGHRKTERFLLENA